MYTLKVEFEKNTPVSTYSNLFVKAGKVKPGDTFLMPKGYPHAQARFMVVEIFDLEDRVVFEVIKIPTIHIAHKNLLELIDACTKREGDNTYVYSLKAFGIDCHVTKPTFRHSKQALFCSACGGLIEKSSQSLRVELASSYQHKSFPWPTTGSSRAVSRTAVTFHSTADQCEQGYMLAQKYLIWNKR